MRRLRGGFTLIELLVVVAIIALLISILLPALSEAKKRAQETMCASNIRQMGLGLRHYLDDNNGFYPGDHLEVPSGSLIAWAPRIRKYMDSAVDVFWCPSTDVGVRWQKRQGGRRSPHSRFLGYEPGEAPMIGSEFFSYGYNGWGVQVFTNIQRGQQHLGLGGHIGGSDDDFRGNQEFQESKIKRPEEMIAIGDTFMNADWDTWITPDIRQESSNPSKRHRGGAEILFTDGHAVNVHFDELVGKRNIGTLNRSAVAMRRWNNDFQPHHNYWRHYP